MRKSFAFLALLLPIDAWASCVAEDPRRIEIRLSTCQEITLDPSPSPASRGNGRIPYHTQEAKRITGTLVGGLLVNAGDIDGSPVNERRAEFYVVHMPAIELCKMPLPSVVSLTVEPRCCDVIPRLEGCISPFPTATLERKREQ
jgi:hypothetical protein